MLSNDLKFTDILQNNCRSEMPYTTMIEIWKNERENWLKHKPGKTQNSIGEGSDDKEQNTERLRHRKPEKPMSDGKNSYFYAHIHIYCQILLRHYQHLEKIVPIKMNSLCCMFLDIQQRF